MNGFTGIDSAMRGISACLKPVLNIKTNSRLVCTGGAGVGKSALVREMVARARAGRDSEKPAEKRTRVLVAQSSSRNGKTWSGPYKKLDF